MRLGAHMEAQTKPMNRVVTILFVFDEEDAKRLYGAADRRNINISALIRSILINRTNNFTDVDDLPPVDLTGRKNHRRDRFLPSEQEQAG